MLLSEELRSVILQDLIEAFEAKYGDAWIFKLTTNLRPSPIQHIAHQRGVKVSDVRKVRSQLLAIGHMILFLDILTQPLPTHDPTLLPQWLIQ